MTIGYYYSHPLYFVLYGVFPSFTHQPQPTSSSLLHFGLYSYNKFGEVDRAMAYSGVVRSNTNPLATCSSYNNQSIVRKQEGGGIEVGFGIRKRTSRVAVIKCGIERSSDGKKGVVSNSNYVVPLDDTLSFTNSSSCITRPLGEILRDLNKRIPDTIVKPHNTTTISPPPSSDPSSFIPWYHANRMLSFYAPGWCGEIRDVIFSDNSTVTVVYRLTVRGSDGEAYRESTGTVSTTDASIGDPVSAAEENAFCKACARFGLGLYLYHEDQMTNI